MGTVDGWVHPPLAKDESKPRNLDKRGYEKELARLQVEVVRLQDWIIHTGLKVVVIFEGRDTAGKGSNQYSITFFEARATASALAGRRNSRTLSS